MNIFRIHFQWHNEHFESRMLIFSVSNGAMNARRYWQWCNDSCILYRLRDEISVVTPHFSFPYVGMNFMPSLGSRILIVNSCTIWRGIFKGLPKDGARTDFSENFRASPFNEDLLNETTFSQIYLAGQHL